MILYDFQRRPVELGASIGRGGEASVYRLAGQPDRLAKIYEPAPRPNYARKLAWMAAHPPANPTADIHHASLAWPDELLFDNRRQLKGYCMPYIRRAASMLDVFNPRRRAEILPQFDRRYLHRVARNLAAALSALHASNYIAGDLNESNLLVTSSALVTLIDADSFQVIEYTGGRPVVHPCPVGKLEYTPPELQGKRLDEVTREPEHDAFALGVLIFQILMEGSHPFRALWLGAGDPPALETRIAKGIFPYTSAPSQLVLPPKGAPPIETLYPWLVELVRRCFVDGFRDPRLRPAPELWERALGEAEKALVNCPAGHIYSNHLRECPICARRQPARPPAAPTITAAPAAPSRARWSSGQPAQPGAATSAAGRQRTQPPAYTAIAHGQAGSPAAVINPPARWGSTGPNPAARPSAGSSISPAQTLRAAAPAGPAAQPGVSPVVVVPQNTKPAQWLRASVPAGQGAALWPPFLSPSGGRAAARRHPQKVGPWLWQRAYRGLFHGGVNGALVGALPGMAVGLFAASGGLDLPWPLLIALGGAFGGFARGLYPGGRVGRWVDQTIGWQYVLQGVGLVLGGVVGLAVGLLFFWAILPLFLGPLLGARAGRELGRRMWLSGAAWGWHKIWAGVAALVMGATGWMIAGMAGRIGLNELAPHLAVALEYGGVSSFSLTFLSGAFASALGGLVAGTFSDFVSGLLGLTD